ncbi:hypothetical protein SORBI_3010G138350 [Sorghum bicolor]|uniref:Uncharacterized protein n=1 Tax=Sorghum bicolor TaxID=4558 RepID=A0A1W0VSY4_SORBI|nr:hypothetical protein SORBI_3010G138350 [Sorghum bicolor]
MVGVTEYIVATYIITSIRESSILSMREHLFRNSRQLKYTINVAFRTVYLHLHGWGRRSHSLLILGYPTHCCIVFTWRSKMEFEWIDGMINIKATFAAVLHSSLYFDVFKLATVCWIPYMF